VLHHMILRYTQALITQMSQTAACNRHHSIDQQLCRWLLLTHLRDFSLSKLLIFRCRWFLFRKNPSESIAIYHFLL